jgi:hypothetical protein
MSACRCPAGRRPRRRGSRSRRPRDPRRRNARHAGPLQVLITVHARSASQRSLRTLRAGDARSQMAAAGRHTTPAAPRPARPGSVRAHRRVSVRGRDHRRHVPDPRTRATIAPAIPHGPRPTGLVRRPGNQRAAPTARRCRELRPGRHPRDLRRRLLGLTACSHGSTRESTTKGRVACREAAARQGWQQSMVARERSVPASRASHARSGHVSPATTRGRSRRATGS